MGQPSGKFDYKVFYSKPPSYDISIESIVPGDWGDEFDDDQPGSKEDKKIKDNEQSQEEAKEELMPYDSNEPLNRKETCMVEVWKDGKKDHTIGVIDIWYNSDKENTEGYNIWTDNQEVNQVTRSGKSYKPIEMKTKKAMEKEEEVKEKDSDEPDDDLILEQLKKAKANVSIWEILMHASSHRKAQVKALTKMNIQTTATPEAIVARITENK